MPWSWAAECIEGSLWSLYLLFGEPALILMAMLHVFRAGCVVAYEAGSSVQTPYIRKKKGPPFFLCAWIKSLSAQWRKWSETWTDNITWTMHTRTRRTSGYPGGYRRPTWKRILLPAVLTCMTAATGSQDSNGLRFDSDSKKLRIDNCLTASITNVIGDFVGKPIAVNVNVKGVGGLVQATHRGTVRWRLEDDEGVIHPVLLPGSYLVPSMPCCLLSPQHWAQVANDHRPHPEGTGCITTSKEVQLFWNQRKNTKTVPLDPNSNVATMTTAAGFDHFSAFSTGFNRMNPDGEQNVECFQAHVIPAEESEEERSTSSTNDEDLSFQDPDPVIADKPEENPKQSTVMPHTPVSPDEIQESEEHGTPDTTNIEFDDTLPSIIPDDPEPQTMSPKDELLRWHYRLGHISFNRLKKLAKRGDIPRKLLDVKTPLCAACQYGKMTRKPWQSKTPNKQQKTWVATAPGQCVSVDQLESTTLGFIAKLKGKLTTQWYQYGTVFVDHSSRMTYIYLQKRLTSDKPFKPKVRLNNNAKY